MIENEFRGLATSRLNRVFLRTKYIVHLYICTNTGSKSGDTVPSTLKSGGMRTPRTP